MLGSLYNGRLTFISNKTDHQRLIFPSSSKPLKISHIQVISHYDMAHSQLPIEAFPAWAAVNSVEFANAEIRNIEGKGLGLVAKHDITDADHDAPSSQAIIQIPRDLILSAETVEVYAKIDRNFKQLFEVAGHQVSIRVHPWQSPQDDDDANIWREHQG